MSIYLTDEHGKLHKVAGAGYGEIDKELNKESTNPVQNKVIYDPVTFAESERQKSKNLCHASGVKAYGTSSVYYYSNPLPVGTYTLSAIVTGDSPDSGCLVEAYCEDGWLTVFSMTKTGQRVSATREFTKPVLELRFYAGATNIWNYVATFTDIMLTTDGSADYQPYNGAITHNGDASVLFAESERQKSKNLLVYPYPKQKYIADGLTFEELENGSIRVNGQQNSSNWTEYIIAKNLILPAGTYTLHNFSSVEESKGSVTIHYGNTHMGVSTTDKYSTFRLNETTACSIGIQVEPSTTYEFNNVIIKPMLVKGLASDYQPYNGAIVHEKDINGVERLETIYDKTSTNSEINKGYTNGIQFGVEASFPGMQSKYKGWYFTFHIHDAAIRMYTPNINIGHNSTTNRIVFAAADQGVGAAIAYGSLNIVYDGITASGCSYFHCDTHTNTVVNNDERYYISKIEGVLL